MSQTLWVDAGTRFEKLQSVNRKRFRHMVDNASDANILSLRRHCQKRSWCKKKDIVNSSNPKVEKKKKVPFTSRGMTARTAAAICRLPRISQTRNVVFLGRTASSSRAGCRGVTFHHPFLSRPWRPYWFMDCGDNKRHPEVKAESSVFVVQL